MIYQPKHYKRRPLIVAVERFYRLTASLADKMEKANANVAKYTVFVNKKHTLAHLLFKEDDVLVRIPVKAKLIKEPDHVVEAYLSVRLGAYLHDFKI